MLKDFEVFKPGVYPQGTWTLEQVQQMCADYNPTLLKAPVTKDHAQWGEASGWIVGARMEGDVMVATCDLTADMCLELELKRYANRSIEILDRLEETGRPYLGAVSFLGAATPQVKGLANTFLLEGRKYFTYEGGEKEEIMRTAEERRGTQRNENKQIEMKGGSGGMTIKEWLKGFFSEAVDKADESKFAELGLTENVDAAKSGDTMKHHVPEVSASQTRVFAMNPEDKAKFAAMEAENARLKAENATARAATRTTEIHAFCEGMKREGKLLPAWQSAGLERFMESLEGNEQKLKFAEADAAVSASEWFRGFLKGLPKLVEFSEIANAGNDVTKIGDAQGGAVNEEHEFMAVSKQFAQERKITLSDAMSHVSKTQPELHKAFLEFCEQSRK